VSFALSANVEKLVLTGSNAINGTGNGLKNVLLGNSVSNKLYGNDNADKLLGNDGNDSLYGGNGIDTLEGGGHSDLIMGGLGHDSLLGGGGADAFLFNTALNESTNVDTITDFLSGIDRIRLDDDIFTVLGPVGANTPLAAAKFHKAAGATAAHDADDRIIYNTSTGALYYDADGQGGDAAVQFATLGTASHPNLVAGDLIVVV
jgi:Ca2+-binding RTX toxin-like protein